MFHYFHIYVKCGSNVIYGSNDMEQVTLGQVLIVEKTKKKAVSNINFQLDILPFIMLKICNESE